MSIAEQGARSARRPKPQFVARVKVNGGWQTVGAAWAFRSGEEGLSVQLNTLPINFDGRFVLMPPLVADAEQGEE